jgi:hypothetical protein
MGAMGYNPKRPEDRRKFAELGEKTKEVSKDILVKSLLAGATAASVSVAKSAVSELMKKR